MNPIAQLAADRTEARAAEDPWAALCCVGTADSDGQVHMRTLVLRDVNERLAIFCSATSPKWRQISEMARIAILTYLPSLQVQYRIRATTSEISKAIIDESWQFRPDMPKKLDWLYDEYPQSSSIDLSVLTDGLSPDRPPPTKAPETARGLYLDPVSVERLQLGRDIHVREEFKRASDGTWVRTLLVP